MPESLDRRPPQTAPKPRGFRKVLLLVEKEVKEELYDCRMCGQCILHSTGLACPMRCPKNLRNGPCGGVLQDGSCEVLPDQPCVWVEAWDGSRRLPLWREHMEHLNPPVDWRLQETSSWENFLSAKDRQVPKAWAVYEVSRT